MSGLRKKHLVRPFAALRPIPDLAQEVVAPPYDVVNTEEAIALAKDKPWSFLHISKPEIDLPTGIDAFSDEVYAKAQENINRMIEGGILGLIRMIITIFIVFKWVTMCKPVLLARALLKLMILN